MTDAELHIALREVVAIGRRGGYDNDEIADKLIGVVRDYANDFAAMKLTEAAEGHYRSLIAGADVVMVDDVLRRARALTDHRRQFEPCGEAPIGIVTNCAAMGCDGKGCAVAAAETAPPVSLDDLAECPTHGVCPNCREGWGHYTPEHGYLPTVQSKDADR